MKYTIKDVEKLSFKDPRKYPLPKEDILKSIRPGCFVKLIAEKKVTKFHGTLYKEDRIIVNILSNRGDQFKGIVDYASDNTIVGSIVKFTYKHVLFVYNRKREIVNLEQYATISHRALDNKEINWAFKTTPLSDKDSGWQLFYGNEDKEYIIDSGNSQRISMKEVLAKEPLLEYVFSSRMDNAEYIREKNKFVPI